MASGYDKLVHFLLSEIALCGVQGASSADFYRFVDKYYEQQHASDASQSVDKDVVSLPPAKPDRIIYERGWQWVVNHPDVRITHQNQDCSYSLPEFEAAEADEPGTMRAGSNANHAHTRDAPTVNDAQPSKALLSIRTALKGRLAKEGSGSDDLVAVPSQIPTPKVLRQTLRQVADSTHSASPIFSDPDPNITAPRLYVSQSRTWQALTGHGIDLTRVPAMEFVLLSLIAAQGPKGIAQPDLTMLSGQDKRSVPHRTDELARKGYIVKNPVQAAKTRTSLCVHKSFVSQNHFLSSYTVDDVFQEGTLVLSGFVHLLYRKLKDAGIVTTRDLRTRLGVPMRTWNKRATQGALIRLDQTGMIKRFRARKTHSDDSWATCIKVLREPRDEDVNNLGFRRQVNVTDDTAEELLDDDVDGDTLMRDIEVDMLDSTDGDINTYVAPEREISDEDRFPPQWTPDRFFANMVFEVIALSGKDGCDSGTIRNRIIGQFWRRPMESYLTRLTENWKKTQPFPVRHLAIIRDTRNTEEKKFVHYVYRTYENFEEAVQAGEVHWEGVSKPVTNGDLQPKQPNKKEPRKMILDAWGFYSINTEDLVCKDGSATLSEARSAIVHPRTYGPRWDNALNLEIGYERLQTPIGKKKDSKDMSKLLGPNRDRTGKAEEKKKKQKSSAKDEDQPIYRISKTPKSNKKVSFLSLTPEQRISLGLKPTGRLTKLAEKQIIAHRKQSGDPTSLPDKIEEPLTLKGKKQPLLTREERIAQGLPARGRLGIEKENELRAARGLAPLTKKMKKPYKRASNEPVLLSREQRLAFGWKGNGRLPQDLIDGLRLEREDGISLNDSKILPKYMDILKARAAKPNGPEPHDAVENQTPSPQDDSTLSTGQQELQILSQPPGVEPATDAIPSPKTSSKRKTRSVDSSLKELEAPSQPSGVEPTTDAALSFTASAKQKPTSVDSSQKGLEAPSQPSGIEPATDVTPSSTAPAKRKTRSKDSASHLSKKQRLNSNESQKGSTDAATLLSPDSTSDPAMQLEATVITPSTATISVNEDISTTYADLAAISTPTPVGNAPASSVEEQADTPLPEGLCSTISEVEPLPPPEPRPRSKRDTITEGSALIFRRIIIREIIDLCGGVFPDGGEIGRPFHTLWFRRHGHVKGLKEPITSTVNSTMRDMCNYPEKFGLKRMSFLTKHKNSPLTSTRSMITYANLTRSSPAVLQLASDMANFSTERSHQFFPEQIRHLCDDKPTYYSQPIAPKDDSIILRQNNPELEAKIKEAQKKRRRERAQQKRDEEKARRIKDARVESMLSRHSGAIDDDFSGQRARLASLNHTTRRYRVLMPKPTTELPGKETKEHDSQESAPSTPDAESQEKSTRESSVESEWSEDIPLIWLRPIVGPSNNRGRIEQECETGEAAEPPRDTPIVHKKDQKRARITVPSDIAPKKKARFNTADPEPTVDDDYVHVSSDESEEFSLSEGEEEDEDENSETEKSKKRTRMFKGRQRGKLGPLPTLLERLTGLTGDPNDPIYQPPERKSQLWSEKKMKTRVQLKKARKCIDSQDPIDKFKKLCCTLAIASSMTGQNGVVDWDIVQKVYKSDNFFNLAKAKKFWTWMQSNMTVQLAGITESFQSAYLEAYENGEIPEMDDPETYDWKSLVQWAMPTCKYPNIPLPAYPEALSDFVVEKSSFESLDRAKWYREKIVDLTRTRIQNRTTFAVPLHRSRKLSSSADEEVVKARSWVRANTATPQAVYDAYQAHDKFKDLSEPVLANVVGDCVEKKALRMRKLKRLLPGRNYNFTHSFAKKFARSFELSDFMLAVKTKKDMDVAFTAEDSQERFYSISHFEEEGSIIVIHNLLSQGEVRLVPQLPPVNHEFKAPLPRLSVWGFCDGSYLNRRIDKNRMFWDIHVVPTEKYQFGSPLQPLSSSLPPTETSQLAEWPLLPNPPLPGHDDETANLPIWSSIDGEKITWPWWYRILNLILQPLIFQPGATAAQLFAHCPEQTTELFEIELILDWLESVGAVSKTIGGGYMTAPGFWAVFGDKLLDTEDDWFGEAVKRKTKIKSAKRWRDEYNLRHSALLAGETQTAEAGANGEGGGDAQTLAGQEPSAPSDGPLLAGIEAAAASVDTESVHTPGTIVEMVDAGGEDIDAEGEEDDDLYSSPVGL